MTNVAKVLRSEIARISRKEVNYAIGEIRKSSIALKKNVADLKKRVAFLEKENKRLMATARKQKAEPAQIQTEETTKARLTSKGIRSLRNRLGLSRPQFAKLLGTTANSVYMWEKKGGALRLRGSTKASLLSIRGLGVREVKRRLAADQPKSKPARRVAPKKRKAK